MKVLNCAKEAFEGAAVELHNLFGVGVAPNVVVQSHDGIGDDVITGQLFD